MPARGARIFMVKSQATDQPAKLSIASALKSAAKGSDSKALHRQMDEFNESLQKIGQHIYQQAGGPAGAAPQGGSPAPEGGQQPEAGRKTEDDVVDADYREVN